MKNKTKWRKGEEEEGASRDDVKPAEMPTAYFCSAPVKYFLITTKDKKKDFMSSSQVKTQVYLLFLFIDLFILKRSILKGLLSICKIVPLLNNAFKNIQGFF